MYLIETFHAGGIFVCSVHKETLGEVCTYLESQLQLDRDKFEECAFEYKVSPVPKERLRVTLENIRIGDTYYLATSTGTVVEQEYTGDEGEQSQILNNLLGCWYKLEYLTDAINLTAEVVNGAVEELEGS